MKHNSRKSPNKRKGVLMAKATLSRKEKPLITDTIKRKVTEILRIGLFNKIKLLSANKVCAFIFYIKGGRTAINKRCWEWSVRSQRKQ